MKYINHHIKVWCSVGKPWVSEVILPCTTHLNIVADWSRLTSLQRPLKITVRSQRHVLLVLLEAQKKWSAANSWFKDTRRDLTTMPLFCQVISTTLQTTAATALRQNDEGLQISAVWIKNAERLPTRCNQSDSHCTNESNSPAMCLFAIEDLIQLVCTYSWFTCVSLHSHVWTTVKCITSLCMK